MPELVLRKDDNGLCTLMLNRPEKLNALNVDVFKALRAHVDDLERSFDTIGCVVLRGSGRCFSAGHDLMDIGAGEQPPYPHYQSETVEHLSNLPQPLISAVHGHCYTGALELALAGDIILAAASARFADTHGKWALTPIWGMSQRLPRRVGAAKAKEMMFTSRTYNAEEAVAMGLANLCVSDEDFDREVEALARAILANSWFSNRANKRLIGKTDGLSLAEGLRYEIEHNEGVGPDVAERISSFGKKK
ncbi:MAG: enoyl-CoA hydratase/isomerase family protein [Deltaproteobacteria bacterium]|nr:enoyl-CoA hydratase/isomerase family protein [Deltaproteobacteria bacterium]